MALNLNTAEIQLREHRLASITAFTGSLAVYAHGTHNCALKKCERCFKQSSNCLATVALHQFIRIKNLAVVYHAPAGCAAVITGEVFRTNWKDAKMSTGYEKNMQAYTQFVATDLNEPDTVFGATKKLRELIRHTYETYHPDGIVISTGCVAGIIGEDVESIAEELSDEIPVPVFSAHCEGFKSNIWANGFDVADHAILQSIVKAPREKRNVINVRDFHEKGRGPIREALKAIGFETQFFYFGSTLEELSHLSENAATVCVCGTLGTYIGNALEQKYGVPYIATASPNGIAGFEEWYREVARRLNKSEDAERYIAEQKALYLPKIEELKKELRGKTCVVAAGPGFSLELARVLEEIGIKVVYTVSWHSDSRFDDDKFPEYIAHAEKTLSSDMTVKISDLQHHELENVLYRYKPDFFVVRHRAIGSIGYKHGCATLFANNEYVMFGYKNVLKLAHDLCDLLRNTSFEKNLAQHVKSPYTDWWHQQNDNKFIVSKTI